MFQMKPAARLAITIGFVCLSLLCVALGIKLVPDPKQAELENRLALVRSIATTVTTLAETNRIYELRRYIERSVIIDPKIQSIGLRGHAKDLISAGEHETHWRPIEVGEIVADQISVDLFVNNRKWGSLEIAFAIPPQQSAFVGLFAFPVPLIAFLFASVTLVSWYVLGRTFRYLNPSRIIPGRVRSALDSIGSGLAMITPEGEIAHANKAFNKIVRKSFDEVVGLRIDDFHWTLENDLATDFPWNRSRKNRESIVGEIVQARINSGVVQKFLVSSTPIFAAENQFRGVLVSFEDVTALEAKKSELAKIIQTVRQSRDEVQRQNEQLYFLANYDSLTRCMNRRSFYAEFERLWNQKLDHPLTIMIMDIDSFKKINDNHGHSIGDEVLIAIGALLHTVIGSCGSVCRYGGEEFTVLLPNLSFEDCIDLAENVRKAIEKDPISGLNVTTSVGLSNRSLGAADGQQMLDQADECLYAAKRNGRNQVVRYDRIHEYHSPRSDSSQQIAMELATNKTSTGEQPVDQHVLSSTRPDADVEFSSVTGLLSALSFRSRETAEHSIRVADLAVDIGRSLLSNRELYFLEIAALLHDVGKIGVPDSILNKPGRLTDDEWNVMQRHDEIGIAIVRSAFSSATITETIETYYTIKNAASQRATNHQERLSVSSQILYVCDAFDSMVSGSIYRKGMTIADALTEIIQNTPSQFDPVIVSELIEFIQSGRMKNRQSGSIGRPTYPPSFNEKDQSASTAAPTSLIVDGEKPDQELERLIDLADEVMTLHYQTRSVFDTDSFAIDQTLSKGSNTVVKS